MVDTRRDFSLYQAPNAGVEADVKTILQRVVHLFDETEQLRFQSFCDIWKDMNFSLVCVEDMDVSYLALFFLEYCTFCLVDLLWPGVLSRAVRIHREPSGHGETANFIT